MIPRRKVNIRFKDLARYVFYMGFKSNERTVQSFELGIAKYLGVEKAACFGSGRNALIFGMRALGLKRGDEILIPALTLGELIPLLQADGYEIKTVDCSPENIRVGFDQVKEAVGPKTKAIMITHLMGGGYDVEKICEFAQKKGIYLIEDAAHSFGAKYDEKYLGTYGDIGMYSLEATKPLNCYGGGVLVARQNATIEKAKELEGEDTNNSNLKHFKKVMFVYLENLVLKSYLFTFISRIVFHPKVSPLFEKFYRATNSAVRGKKGFSDLAAYIGLRSLEGFEKEQNEKKKLYRRIKEALLSHDIKFDNPEDHSNFVFYMLVIFHSDPASMRTKLQKIGVDVGIKSEVLDDCSSLVEGEHPNAKEKANSIISFPCDEKIFRKIEDCAKILEQT